MEVDPEVAEEQAMEMEALQAIYMEDLEVLNTSPHEFEIKLVPEGSDTLPGVILKVTFTPRYPKEAPLLEVRPLRNIDKASCAGLLEQLQQEAEQNLDMAMVLTLAQSAKESLEQLKDDLIRKAKEREEAIRLKAIEDEKMKESVQERKFAAGTPVTLETFAAWKLKFDVEMKTGKVRIEEDKRLTGRQLFEIDASLFAYDDIDGEELPEF